MMPLELKSVENHFDSSCGFDGLIGSSPSISAARALIERFANTDSPVVITGESGTGKELVARIIHRLSDRRYGPFVKVNCGALPEPVLQIELFGHAQGASSAAGAPGGSFHAACGGTLLLDEVGELSPKLQSSLLRVLRERRFQPVGAAYALDADVRVIASTTQDLRLPRQANLRQKLFYALNVLSLEMPPLRERKADIPLLVRHFSELYARHHARAPIRVDGPAMAALESYDWPGNVLELEKLVERLVLLTDGAAVTLDDLPPYMRPDRPPPLPDGSEITLPKEGIDLDAILAVIENTFISQALRRTGGNKTAAAKLLKLHRTTFFHRLRKKGMLPDSR